MSAGGQNFAGEILSAGREVNVLVSRRDGTVIVRCYGGTGRYLFGVTAGRHGNFKRERYYRWDETVCDDGQGICRRDGTGRREHFDGGFTVPSRRNTVIISLVFLGPRTYYVLVPIMETKFSLPAHLRRRLS